MSQVPTPPILKPYLQRIHDLAVELDEEKQAHQKTAKQLVDAQAIEGCTQKKLDKIEADMAEAAGELMVDIPEPGSDMAKLLHANVMMRKYRIPELEEQLERWKDEYCRMTKIRDQYVDELRRVKVQLENVSYAVRNLRHSILPER